MQKLAQRLCFTTVLLGATAVAHGGEFDTLQIGETKRFEVNQVNRAAVEGLSVNQVTRTRPPKKIRKVRKRVRRVAGNRLRRQTQRIARAPQAQIPSLPIVVSSDLPPNLPFPHDGVTGTFSSRKPSVLQPIFRGTARF